MKPYAMRRTLASLVVLSVLLGPGTAVAAPSRQLTIVSYDNPPFIEAANGQAPRGMLVDIVRELLRRMNTPFELKIYPLPRGLAMMNAGQADAMFTLKKTPAREATFRFHAVPLLTQDYVLFANRDSPLTFKGDLGELANISVGMIDNTSYGPVFDAAARRGAFKKLELAQHHESNFAKLMARRMDVVICSRQVGLAMLKRLNATQRVKVIGPPIDVAPSYLMFNKAAVTPSFLGQLDKQLAAMRNDGSLAKIESRWGVRQDTTAAAVISAPAPPSSAAAHQPGNAGR